MSADGLQGLPVEHAERRQECSHCSRPQKVCLCPYLPVRPLQISTHLYIIQHPAEESKVLRTVPLLAACLPPDKCTVKTGRRFSEERDIELSTVCRDSGTLILYPGAEATNLEEFILDAPVYPSTIILIDGTWSHAKDIFYKNSLFRLPKQVQLKTSICIHYVIRMQPASRCLSTLECAAAALSPSSSSVFFPASAWCSDSPQQGVSSEEWIISQAYAKEQTQTQEDGAVNQQCQNLAHLSLRAGFPVIG